MRTRITVNSEKLGVSSEVLRALTNPLRMKILEFIDQNDEVNVNKIYNTLNLEQSITSQHLKILRLADIVTTRRDGKYVYYSINYGRIVNTVDAIFRFEQNSMPVAAAVRSNSL